MNFHQLQTVSSIRQNLLEKAKAIRSWKDMTDVKVADITEADLCGDEAILKLVQHFGCGESRRLTLFKFDPRHCHAWHTDTRPASINMLLDGWDYLTAFGMRVGPTSLSNIEALRYEPNRYYLMNSKKPHTVFNFGGERYLLSIGIADRYTFKDVLDYIVREGA